MNKFTTEQLKNALIGLRNVDDDAFQMTFDEVAKRMGDVAFDAFCTAQGW